jgi:hypothetical protein
MVNLNSPEYLSKVTAKIIDYLRCINPVPSVEMTEIPQGLSGMNDEMESRRDDEDEDDNPDVRNTTYRLDKHIEHPNELESDSDDDFANLAYNIRRQAQSNGRRNRTDVDNPTGSSSPSEMAPPPVRGITGIGEDTGVVDTEDIATVDAVSGDNVSALEEIVEPHSEAAELAIAPPASPSQVENLEENHSSPVQINRKETDQGDTEMMD